MVDRRTENSKLGEISRLIPESLHQKSGAVFYSGRAAYSGQSPLYMIGVNPGGDPGARPNETVSWHTGRVLQEMPDNWSAYRDESWRNARPGTSGMQPRVLHMLERLGLDPGTVPASNVVFSRSKRESTFSGDFQKEARLCWPLHLAVIKMLRVRVIVCFGRTAGKWVCAEAGASRQIGEFVEANRRRWSSGAYEAASGLRVVVVPHPSIADWSSPFSDPSDLVKDTLG
ncbi:MAG: uracil-DNA glycosylase family protein [Pseudomonadota bacterium]